MTLYALVILAASLALGLALAYLLSVYYDALTD